MLQTIKSALPAGRWRWIWSIGILVGLFLLITSYQLDNRRIINLQAEAHRINWAGRQRMLSQKVSKAALGVQVTAGDVQAAYLAELADALDNWQDVHVALQEGDEALGLPPETEAEVLALYTAASGYLQEMVVAGDQLVARPDDAAALEGLLANEEGFLVLMDDIVFMVAARASEDIAVVRRYNNFRLGMSMTLAALLISAIFSSFYYQAKEQVDRFQLLSEASQDAVLVVADQQIQYGNYAARSFWGRMKCGRGGRWLSGCLNWPR